VQRRLVLHRRPVSAVLAFAAVLCGLAAVTSSPAGDAGWRPADHAGAFEDPNATGGREVPLRLADPAVAAVISPGDVVDIVATGQRGLATVVADEVVVTALPTPDEHSPWSNEDELLMVAVTDAQALAVAGAAARGPVTIVLHR